MMKIHTTQNLSALGTSIQPTNVVSTKDFRSNYLNGSSENDFYVSSMTFKGKKPSKEALNKFKSKIVVEAKKVVGDIKEKAASEEKCGDKILNSSFFSKLLGVADHETLVQAIISCIICMAFRPLTILAISNDKSKQDNTYAAAHSMASGATGVIATLLIANPFKKGEAYAMKHLLKDMQEESLIRLFPHLDIASINRADGTRNVVDNWLDKTGNKFISDLKDVSKIPAFKNLADISAETYRSLGADVDWAAMKGKSFNEVVTKDGKSLADALDWTKIGIQVYDKGTDGPISVLLKNLDKGFLSGIIKDAESGSAWKKLDINSVYDSNGFVKDFRQWKNLSTGERWNLDLDSSFISSALETADYIPEISGKIRKIAKTDGETKFACYLKNGKDGRLGTEITQEMYNADATTDVQKKMLTWLPDIITRPFVAMGTIALIPWMLNNVFHLSKGNKPDELNAKDSNSVNQEKTIVYDKNEDIETAENVSFKGRGKPSFIDRFLGKIYGKPMYESDTVRNTAHWLSKSFGTKMTQHFATLGSAVTSSVYVARTINNDNLDADRRKTLSINQILCFIVPTICAYTVDHFLTDFTKRTEYRYSGLKEQQMARLRASGKPEDADKAAELVKKLSGNLRGVRILSGLLTFTLIYRYITPVLITPIANKISAAIQASKKAKQEAESQLASA